MKYLMCNLKSNKTLQEILWYKKQIANINQDNKEFVLFPSNIYLSFFYDTNYKIGSQNVSKYENGNHTGEILASQLKSLNVSYVLINHCEIDEENESAILKIKNATKENLKVVLCIGKEIHENEDCVSKLQEQISEIFNKLTKEEINNIILAYEPCWGINKEDIMDIKELNNIVKNLKVFVNYEYNVNIEIIYGGSINVDNFHKLLEIDILDGYLIGNCSNSPENIINIACKF